MKNEQQAKNNIINVADEVWGMKDVFVNFYMIQNQQDDKWFLIDTGLKKSYSKIKIMAATLFGAESKPSAIILTHAHFDHAGSVAQLAEEWDVPVYVHYLEVPFVTGKSSYPPGDPTVGGGLMASLAFIYPTSPINIWKRVNVLPSDGSVPGLTGWKYYHTPGHAPGHISLFRTTDKVLIAGDAFVTTKPESALAVFLDKKELNGPPKYFTIDWNAARQSVKTLAELKPRVAATGHGIPMHGAQLRDQLLELNQHFDEEAIPEQGRYVNEPAIADTNGIVYIPAKPEPESLNGLAIKAAAFTAALVCTLLLRRTKKNKRLRFNQYLLDFEYNF